MKATVSVYGDIIQPLGKCFACKQVLREGFWPAFIYGLTFRLVDFRRTPAQAWARHQELFNA